MAWRAEESRSERTSPLTPPQQKARSALEGYYGNPRSPGPFEAALYPEIEAGPEGLTLETVGGNPTQRGYSYENSIIEYYGFDEPDPGWKARGLKPDAVDSGMVVEIKYTDSFLKSIYNPQRALPFAQKEVDESIEQAMEYAHGDPPRKIVCYTNDWALAEYYARAFRGVGLSNFRFIIVPAIRKPK